MNATIVVAYTTLCEHDDAVFLLLMLAGVVAASLVCHRTEPTLLATTVEGKPV
jgi:hypothetical protein